MPVRRLALPLSAAVSICLPACGSDPEVDTNPAGDLPTGAATQAVVQVSAQRLGIPVGGSGFVYDLDKRLVLTSASNVNSAEDLLVSAGSGATPIGARIAGMAPCDDVAVLELASNDEGSLKGLQALPLGASNEVEAQEPVTAVGYGSEFGGAESGTVKASRGVVTDPAVEDTELTPILPSFPSLIEFDASLEPEFSGGALLDDSGDAIGLLVVSDLSERTPSYAVPSQRLRRVAEDLADGENPLNEGWLLRPLEEVDLAQEFQIFLGDKLKEAGFTPAEAAEHVEEQKLDGGMYVLSTERKGPADDTNIFPGDLITRIDGEPVRTQAEVCKALGKAGGEAEVDGVAIASSTRIADIGEKFTVVLKIPN